MLTIFDIYIKIEWIGPLITINTIRTYAIGFLRTRKHKNGQRNVIIFHISHHHMISNEPHN